MKKILVTLFIFFCTSLLQSQWYKHTLTSGYTDKNPAFASKYYAANLSFYSGWEFLAFERHVGSNSQIMIARLGQNGFETAPAQLTSHTSLKRNPAIGTCFTGEFISGVTIVSGLALWEDNKNGRWDIYASAYNPATGWSVPFPFDSTSGEKSSPKVIGKDSVIYYIVYEKSGDIIYREFNSRTKTVITDTNLTSDISNQCGNPFVVIGYSIPFTRYVSYERLKPDSTKAIYYKSKSSQSGWSAGDTTAYLGNNINYGFVLNNTMGVDNVFSSNRNGNYLLYHTKIAPPSSNPQSKVFPFSQPNADYFSYKNVFFPVITDELYAQIHTYTVKTDSTRLFFVYPFFPLNPITLGNLSTTNSYALGTGLFIGYYTYKNWVVYSQDSLGLVNLYGRVTEIYLGSVKKIGNEIPSSFSLEQNFPNPFNPVTNIKFDIPPSSSLIRSGVSTQEVTTLKIYNILGKEIKTLVNEYLSPGTYQVSFNAEGLPSGVYFYRLTSTKHYETRKMILLK